MHPVSPHHHPLLPYVIPANPTKPRIFPSSPVPSLLRCPRDTDTEVNIALASQPTADRAETPQRASTTGPNPSSRRTTRSLAIPHPNRTSSASEPRKEESRPVARCPPCRRICRLLAATMPSSTRWVVSDLLCRAGGGGVCRFVGRVGVSVRPRERDGLQGMRSGLVPARQRMDAAAVCSWWCLVWPGFTRRDGTGTQHGERGGRQESACSATPPPSPPLSHLPTSLPTHPLTRPTNRPDASPNNHKPSSIG